MRIGDRLTFANWNIATSSILLIAAWGYANWFSLTWLGQSFVSGSWFNLVLVGLGLVALIVQSGRNYRKWGFSWVPILHAVPVTVMVVAGGGAIALRWFWDVPQISVLLFALGSYGLWGLFIAPTVWRKGLPVAFLFVCLLPFSTQFGTGLGFPARILTAHAVERLLHLWDITVVSANDVIVTENGIARVDLPCSGLRSVWIGTLFLLAVTWLERRQISWRWLLVYGVSLWLFLSVNLVRVLVLVVTTHVLKQPLIAEILHGPLGLLGFICACGIGWGLLRWVPVQEKNCVDATSTNSANETGISDVPPHPALQDSSRYIRGLRVLALQRWRRTGSTRYQSRMLLVGVIAGLGVAASCLPSPQVDAIALPQLPAQIQAEAIALTPVEQNFFASSAATVAAKWRFNDGAVTGSLLVVSSRSWNAFHPPELCLLGSGLTVDRMEEVQLTQTVMARWLSLQSGQLSATYWLQSSQHTTDDFLSRLWEYMVHQNRAWVLVSVLFDQPYQPQNAAIQNFVTTIHHTVQQSLADSQVRENQA